MELNGPEKCNKENEWVRASSSQRNTNKIMLKASHL